jgi:cyclic pyranopterin phosphate synthase
MFNGYLRIVLNQDCNFTCKHCHREGLKEVRNKINIQKIKKILKIGRLFDIKVVTITGGEPLLSKKIFSIIKTIKKFNNIKKITIVTNGSLLKLKALKLRKNGVDEIHVSLPTLDKKIFQYITHNKEIENVIEAIKYSRKIGLKIKINCVILKDINDSEEHIKKMINFGKENDVIIRFIELQKFNTFSIAHYVPYKKFKNIVRKYCKFQKMRFRNISQYIFKNSIVECLKCPCNGDFCGKCSSIISLVLTPNLYLKPCMKNNKLIFSCNGTDTNIYKSFKKSIEFINSNS